MRFIHRAAWVVRSQLPERKKFGSNTANEWGGSELSLETSNKTYEKTYHPSSDSGVVCDDHYVLHDRREGAREHYHHHDARNDRCAPDDRRAADDHDALGWLL